MVSQKVLCLGFVRGNGITPLSLIMLLYMYFLIITFIFVVVVGFFRNFYYFDLLPLEFILFVTLLILFHNFFLTSHHFPPWKRFVISKRAQTHTHV